MAGRIQETLASLFLSPQSNSIYAHLDDDERASAAPPTSDDGAQDPFSATSPSVLSPASSSRAPLRSPPPRAGPSHVQQLGDSRSPFHDEPLDSIFLDRVRHGPESSSSQSRSPTRSPPSRRRRMPSGAGGLGVASGMGMGMGSSGIGNRSLMGLLGGTRYEPIGFDGLRVGADVLEEGPGDEDSVASGMLNPDDSARGRGGARLCVHLPARSLQLQGS